MDRLRTTLFYRKHLPHWEVRNGVYFITIRLHNSLPREIGIELKKMNLEIADAEDNRKQALRRKQLATMERLLDTSTDRLFLREKVVATMVMASIRSMIERQVWNVAEYVIMPNHLHLFVQFKSESLWQNMISFKRWTGRKAVEILGWQKGPFWEEEWFDHWARTQTECVRIVEYIRNNPVKARLVANYHDWPYGSWNDIPAD